MRQEYQDRDVAMEKKRELEASQARKDHADEKSEMQEQFSKTTKLRDYRDEKKLLNERLERAANSGKTQEEFTLDNRIKVLENLNKELVHKADQTYKNANEEMSKAILDQQNESKALRTKDAHDFQEELLTLLGRERLKQEKSNDAYSTKLSIVKTEDQAVRDFEANKARNIISNMKETYRDNLETLTHKN